MVAAGDPTKISDVFTLNTFTPTYTNLTIGAGAINEGWWQRIGDLVAWGFRTEFGTAPSGPATSYLVDLPVTAWPGGGVGLQAAVGSGVYRATGGTNWVFVASIFGAAGTQVAFTIGNSGGARASSGSALPIAAAIGHSISISGVYRAA